MNVKNSSKPSCPCKRLKNEENEAIFLLLGKSCQSQCTTIAQVYESTHNRWLKKCSGVLCFIKDNIKRSYFLRMYCLILHEMVWEQEIYNEFVIEKVRPFLLEFEGNKAMTALNFCFEDEASDLMSIVMTTITNRNKRREERMQSHSAVPPPLRSPPQPPNEFEKPQQISYQSSQPNQKPKKKRKITKDDIGVPRNFRHEVHVGADGIRSICDTEEIRQFLHQAGLSETDLRNPKTKKYVEKFVRKNEGPIRQSMMKLSPPAPPTTLPPELPKRDTDSLKRDMRNRPVPPVPISNPSPMMKTSRAEISLNPSASAGPPPPPLPKNVPPPPPIEFKQSTQAPRVADPRGELLASIRGGKTLKKVVVDENPQMTVKSDKPDKDDLASALNNFLKSRRGVIRDSSDSEDEQSENACEDDDWEA